ncbi:hypothetical protein AVEN_247900-1 [Araneus ventricosus]|uniref:Uncharacterized protein n=1 Tax=Araneus ventricosus TaxID=182803 RepID=A0A4Y2PEK5_ARAVE|nr:hypothetical protein AVEN_247900-1 [Araneus ventricosus]
MRIVSPAESYEPPATTEKSEIILNQMLQNVLELKAQIKKLLADYLDLPESANLEESLDIIYIMEEEIDDLKRSSCPSNKDEFTGTRPKKEGKFNGSDSRGVKMIDSLHLTRVPKPRARLPSPSRQALT